MKYISVPDYERTKIEEKLFNGKCEVGNRIYAMVSSIHYHGTDFFVELFPKIMEVNDLDLKMATVRSLGEFMRIHNTLEGYDGFVKSAGDFISRYPEHSDEVVEILEEMQEFHDMYS